VTKVGTFFRGLGSSPRDDGAGSSRRGLWRVIVLVAVFGLVAGTAYTWGRLAGESEQPRWAGPGGESGSPDNDVLPGALSKIPTGAPKDVQLRTTGYSFQDNTPRNSDKISGPTVHKVAGGTGTYEDPISVAIPGHGGRGAQIPIGTRIYYKPFQFYGIVEDTG
jgi:hypothetical protein